MSRLRLGTRGSPLALWQARHVAELLRAHDPACEIEECIIGSDADDRAEVPVATMGQGVFVRRIERALLEHRADVAVHSMKDLPSVTPEGLVIAAVPRRHDPHDALVSLDGVDLDGLPRGARVGTGSARRQAQLLHLRPDLDVTPIRGNVDTRVKKLQAGEVDALMLAVAGLERLGIRDCPARPLPSTICLPAAGQGALAIQTRSDDDALRTRLQNLVHETSMAEVTAERAFLAEIGAGCLAPTTAHATTGDGRLRLEALVATPDGRVLLLDRETGPIDEASVLGTRLARRLSVAGGARILAAARTG